MPKIAFPLVVVATLFCSTGRFLSEESLCILAADAPQNASEFQNEGVAFLKKNCLGCHGEKVQEADLSLYTYRDAASILKDRKVWQNVIQMVKSGEMPPKEKPRPALAEVEVFLKSIQDVFARADGKVRDPGQVTIRRLNRTEYNNTIRDLFGVDFNPAEDFPPDDVGYGFDNIGDVLSLSPVLLERYLSAAESIGPRILIIPPRRQPFRTDALFLVPQGNDIKDGFRPIATRKRRLDMRIAAGQIGEFTLRGRAFGTQIGDEPVQAVLLLGDKEIRTVEIKAADATSAEVFEFNLQLNSPKNELHIGISLANELKTDDGQRTLWIQFLDLIQPDDNRPAALRSLFPFGLNKPQREPLRECLTRLASKAYRRPTTADEVERLEKLFEAAEARGKKWDAALQLAAQAILVSPKFLYRVELDDRPDASEQHPIDEYQLASRLSYFLWSSMPDDELLAAAEAKTLSANLESQVRRMLQDPKAKSLEDNFAMQWLQLRRLQIFVPDAKQFPTFNEPLRQAMLKETEFLFEAIRIEDRSILDLIDADFTFLNEPLARHYGIVDTNGNRAGQPATKPAGKPIRGNEFQRVSLSDAERGGILTQASVLTATSNPTRTSPVKRGHWVLEQILGTPPPPPPPNVPPLPETAEAIVSGTLRQRLEQHRANPACANCHARIDPLGFAFENYNSIGAFRTKDGEFPIDPAGTLPDGKTFNGPAELKAILKGKSDQFTTCLAEKMLTYALGRGVEYYDKPTVDRLTAALARDNYKFSTLIIEIVRSDPFRLRRGKEPSK